MKKLILIALLAVFSFAACGGKKNAAKPATTGSATTGSGDMGSGHDMGSGSAHDADGHDH